MKLRSKPVRGLPGTTSSRVSFVQVEQAGMFVARDVEQNTKLLSDKRVKGSFVKFAPTVPASERASIDSSEVRQKFIAAGAAACVVTPIIIPDSSSGQKREGPNKLSAEQQLRLWFESVKGSAKLLEQALEEAMKSVGDAGL
jgi:hypothetical protein